MNQVEVVKEILYTKFDFALILIFWVLWIIWLALWRILEDLKNLCATCKHFYRSWKTKDTTEFQETSKNIFYTYSYALHNMQGSPRKINLEKSQVTPSRSHDNQLQPSRPFQQERKSFHGKQFTTIDNYLTSFHFLSRYFYNGPSNPITINLDVVIYGEWEDKERETARNTK